MPKPVFAFCLLIWWLTFVIGFAQENKFIIGKLLDAKTGEPVVFASIRIKGRSLGVISNADGGVKIPLKYKTYGDTLEISSMGYELKKLLIKELSEFERHIFRLNPGTLSLSEAVVTAKKKRELSPRQIVRKAIRAIPKNYPLESFSVVGYYRDYQLDSVGYVNLNEALLEVFDNGFDEIDTTNTKTRIYDYVQNMNFRRDTLADKPYNYSDWDKIVDNAFLSAYGGNEFIILKIHDALRNYKLNSFDFVNNINELDILKNHSFKRLMDSFLVDELLHTIQLRKVHPDYTALGKIFISKKDFAIHKLEYAMYDDRKQNSDSLLRQQKIKGELIYKVTTEYQRSQNEKMYPNYISLCNTFQLTQPPKFTLGTIYVLSEEGLFAISFNNPLDTSVETTTDPRSYDFRYKGKKLNFKEIQTYGDSVVLSLDMSSKERDNMLRELDVLNTKRLGTKEVLKIDIKGLVDIDGNLLNQWTYKEYNQFREFFVQFIDSGASKPLDSLLMNKSKPIFKDQPFVKPDNFEDYWMNTPLKKIN